VRINDEQYISYRNPQHSATIRDRCVRNKREHSHNSSVIHKQIIPPCRNQQSSQSPPAPPSAEPSCCTFSHVMRPCTTISIHPPNPSSIHYTPTRPPARFVVHEHKQALPLSHHPPRTGDSHTLSPRPDYKLHTDDPSQNSFIIWWFPRTWARGNAEEMRIMDAERAERDAYVCFSNSAFLPIHQPTHHSRHPRASPLPLLPFCPLNLSSPHPFPLHLSPNMQKASASPRPKHAKPNHDLHHRRWRDGRERRRKPRRRRQRRRVRDHDQRVTPW
jgi:hypothetical protein